MLFEANVIEKNKFHHLWREKNYFKYKLNYRKYHIFCITIIVQ